MSSEMPDSSTRSKQGSSSWAGLMQVQLFSLSWMQVNVVGFAIATPLSFSIRASTSYFEALFVAGLIVGAVIGPMQAMVLKRQIHKLKVWQWTLANIFGSYLGSWAGLLAFWSMLAIFQAFNYLPNLGGVVTLVLTLATYGAVIGLLVSCTQLISLRNYAQGLRQWWLANFLGRTCGWLSAGIIGWLISSTTGLFTETSMVVWGALLGAIGGAIYARMTAKALQQLKPLQPHLPSMK